MAIYHLSMQTVSRAKGFSAVAKSAYNSCDKIKNEYDGTVHNYSNKPQHTYHEILLPQNAPEEWKDKAKLWNEVELSEKSKNARLCRSYDIALPKELNQNEQEKLIHDFCKENFSDKGMCVQIDIHTNEKNPHAHVMTTCRELDDNGNWKTKSYKEYLCTNGEKEKYFKPSEIPEGWEKVYTKSGNPKTRKVDLNNWNEKDTLKEYRKSWADKCNEKLKEKGVKEITHLSHKDRELYKQPQIHLGNYNNKLIKEGKTNERIEEYKNIIEYNKRVKEIRQAFNQFFEKLKSRKPQEVNLKAEPKVEEKEIEKALSNHNQQKGFMDRVRNFFGKDGEQFKLTREQKNSIYNKMEYVRENYDFLKKNGQETRSWSEYRKDFIDKQTSFYEKEWEKGRKMHQDAPRTKKTVEMDNYTAEVKKQLKTALERIEEQFQPLQELEWTVERLQELEHRRKQMEELNEKLTGNRYGIKARV